MTRGLSLERVSRTLFTHSFHLSDHGAFTIRILKAVSWHAMPVWYCLYCGLMVTDFQGGQPRQAFHEYCTAGNTHPDTTLPEKKGLHFLNIPFFPHHHTLKNHISPG